MAISINFTKTADPLSNSGTLLAEGVLSAREIVFALNTAQANVTAFVTGVTVSETKDGAPIFENGSVGSIFTATFPTFPVTVSKAGGSVVNTLTIPVTATGNPCALGAQTLTYTLTLSSKALSGNGTTAVTETVSNSTATLNTVVTAVNTPFNGRVCKAEFSRLRNLEII